MDQRTSMDRLDDLRRTLERISSGLAPEEKEGVVSQAFEQLEGLGESIQADNQKSYQFINFVVHELRLPMTSIMGYTDLLRKEVVGPVNDQQQAFLNIIRNSVGRMAALVSDLSDLNKMEAGKLKLELAELSLEGFIGDVVHNLQPIFLEKKLALGVQIPPDLPDVLADPNRLIKVVTNLLTNAASYTPQGGQVGITARPVGRQVRVEVSDTGIGIRPEDQAQLFQQFFRSEDAYVREQPGWGLGLSVVKGLVELMGGKVGMDSQPGEGSTFWFTLPAARD